MRSTTRSLVATLALIAAVLVFAPRPTAAGGVHVSIGIPLPVPVVTVAPVVPYGYYGPAYAPVVPYGYYGYAPYGGYHRHHAHCGHGHYAHPGRGYGHYKYRDSYRGAGYGRHGRHPGVHGYTLR
jgi:hypothetical protein